ncbi:peroxidase superfamily protein [Actinidia rufa]|uniref:Peroxidase n=1 Tax=Actinidia rufa TaxID=165716 RepID=A0A7J0FSN4_9ERIC|nr:peroxidase superfamily protein [Actinidia rufa]
MASSSCFSSSMVIHVTLILLVLQMGSSYAQLSTNFYSTTCPNLLSTVKPVVESAVSKEKRMGASLLRLHFHDCFVNGCDGSILLDDTSSFTGEKTAGPNNNSVRGYSVIDDIKSKVEAACPGVVSCADIVAIRCFLGGLSWEVKLGRRDSKTASFSDANSGLPGPDSNLSDLISRNRIYNETNIDASFAKTRQGTCPNSTGSGDDNQAPLDLQTPNLFDNNYFKNLIVQKGLLHSDQVLHNGGSTDSLVETYSKNSSTFSSDFAAAMIKMGDISPLTGSNGEIRKECSKVNG